jgi:hydrogenase maturation factor
LNQVAVFEKRKMSDVMRSGKLPHDFLEELLETYTSADASVVSGPAVGIDATILRPDRDLLFAKTDPVTFVTDDLGYYVVNINANDLAAIGGEPKWFLVTLLFPSAVTDRREIESVFKGIREACDQLSVSFCGGHTEVTDAVKQVVASGTMLGQSMAGRTFQASLADIGDSIVMTKGVAVEGTSIIARERRREITDEWGEDFVARCRDYLVNPGISVLPEARIAVSVPGVHAMHDPTEGGVATALHELADASDTDLDIDGDSIRIFPETRVLSKRYGIEPLGLIASGSLLIAVDPESANELVKALSADGIEAGIIGRLVDNRGQRRITTAGVETDLKRYDMDEILKV